MNAIVAGVNGFFSDYSQYPGTTHALDGNAGLIDELSATEKAVINTRKTVFFETETAMSGPAEDFLDPWGIPYRIYLDVGVAPDQKAYDGKINIDFGGGIRTYLTPCIAISSGPNKSFGDADDVFNVKQF